jgi:hypothetical protein
MNGGDNYNVRNAWKFETFGFLLGKGNGGKKIWNGFEFGKEMNTSSGS